MNKKIDIDTIQLDEPVLRYMVMKLVSILTDKQLKTVDAWLENIDEEMKKDIESGEFNNLV